VTTLSIKDIVDRNEVPNPDLKLYDPAIFLRV